MKHIIRPAAKDDIIRQFRYYLLEDAFETATSFLDAVDESIEAICQMPILARPSSSKTQSSLATLMGCKRIRRHPHLLRRSAKRRARRSHSARPEGHQKNSRTGEGR